MAAIDLLCWMDIESFRALPVGDKVLRNVKAKHLKTTYFNNKYFFGPNSPANKEAWRQVGTDIDTVKPNLYKQSPPKEDTLFYK